MTKFNRTLLFIAALVVVVVSVVTVFFFVFFFKIEKKIRSCPQFFTTGVDLVGA